MPRPNLSTAMLAALSATVLYPALFVEADFTSGPVYLWTGYGSVVWNGHTWLGAGTMGSVSSVTEGLTVEARGITLGFSGFDPAMLTHVMGEFGYGVAKVYLGALNGSSVIADPVPIWVGKQDQPDVNISGATATISIACESRMILMNTPSGRRLTNDDQQRDHPGDLGLQFVNGIQELALWWGTVPTTTGQI